MNCTLPYWLQLLQAFSTPAIALLAVVIGLMQWRTAHQRAGLDLFQKRWEAYTALRAVINGIFQHNSVALGEETEFRRAMDQTVFLFGPEVHSYLEHVYVLIIEHQAADHAINATTEEQAKRVIRKDECLKELTQFYWKAEKLLMPYMRMHQKPPWF
jgi:hypothetical protein